MPFGKNALFLIRLLLPKFLQRKKTKEIEEIVMERALSMLVDWDNVEDNSPKATTAQRKYLYRLGLSKSFVKANIKNIKEASQTIKAMLKINSKLKKWEKPTGGTNEKDNPYPRLAS